MCDPRRGGRGTRPRGFLGSNCMVFDDEDRFRVYRVVVKFLWAGIESLTQLYPRVFGAQNPCSRP